MTREYAESIAKGALARLNGMEKILPGDDSLTITINPNGKHLVQISNPSTAGATLVYAFESDGANITGESRYWSDVYGQGVA